MGNRFTAHGSSAERDELKLSNGGTDVFFDVLTLAGCDLAVTAWEQHLVLYFSDGHRLGRGIAGFDLSEIPWTANWQAEKEFFLRVVETAASRHGWDRLSYDPPYATASLTAYRTMVAGFVPVPATLPDPLAWTTAHLRPWRPSARTPRQLTSPSAGP